MGNKKLEKDQEFSKAEQVKEEFTKFISVKYSPIGATEDKVFKSTAELLYDFDNMVDITPQQVAKILKASGFGIQFLSSEPYWVLYEKSSL